MRKQTKIAAIASAAALLAIGASMTSFAAAGWVSDEAGWRYQTGDGDYVYGEWRRSNGKWYFLDEETGYMVTDRLIPYDSESVIKDGNYYYAVDATGARITNAWRYEYNVDGVDVNGVTPEGIWYYFGDNGRSIGGGDKEINGVYYRFNDECQMITGWYHTNEFNPDGSEKVYYYNDMVDEMNGAYGGAFKKWVTLNIPAEEYKSEDNTGTYDELDEGQAWYYFDNKGMRYTGDHYFDRSWWHFNEFGQMQTGFQKCATPSVATDNNPAFFTSNGDKATSKWIYKDGWYYVDRYGTAINYNGSATGTATPKDNEDADVQNNVAAIRVKGRTYLLNNVGKMLSGLYELDNVPVVKGGQGSLDGLYYFSKNDFEDGGSEGWMVTNTRINISDDYDVEREYYFQKNGIAYKNAIVNNAYYNGEGVKISAEFDTYEVKEVVGGDVRLKGVGDPVITNHKEVLISSNGTIVKNRTVSGVEGYKKYFVGKLPGNDIKDTMREHVDYEWVNGYSNDTPKDQIGAYDITCVIFY